MCGSDLRESDNVAGVFRVALTDHTRETVAVVTSNGVAQFMPYAIDAPDDFQQRFSFKLSTAAYGVVELTSDAASISDWNCKAL